MKSIMFALLLIGYSGNALSAETGYWITMTPTESLIAHLDLISTAKRVGAVILPPPSYRAGRYANLDGNNVGEAQLFTSVDGGMRELKFSLAVTEGSGLDVREIIVHLYYSGSPLKLVKAETTTGSRFNRVTSDFDLAKLK